MKPSLLFSLMWLASAGIASAADIKDCGRIGSYKVAPYMALAAELQALPKDAAVARLQKWADTHEYDEQVIILCRMLFEPRPSVEFRRPLLGEPQLYGRTTMKDWPLEPITVVDDVPFLIASSYMIAGKPVESSSYLNYCVSNTGWTPRKYHVASHQEVTAAFEKLLKSSTWKQPLDKWERERIAKQIE